MLTKLKSGAKVLLFTRLTNRRVLKCSFSFLFQSKQERNYPFNLFLIGNSIQMIGCIVINL